MRAGLIAAGCAKCGTGMTSFPCNNSTSVDCFVNCKPGHYTKDRVTTPVVLTLTTTTSDIADVSGGDLYMSFLMDTAWTNEIF